MAVESGPGQAARVMTALRAMPVSISSSITLRMASHGCGKSSTPHATRSTSPPRSQSCAGRAPSQPDVYSIGGSNLLVAASEACELRAYLPDPNDPPG
jgi:hypothetical protein